MSDLTPPPTADPVTTPSQRRTIGLILGGVILVGLLGGLAGVVFDGDHARERPAPGKVSPTDPAVVSSAENESASGEESGPLITSSPSLQPQGKTGGGRWVTLAEGVRVYVPPDWQLRWSDEDEINLCSSELTCVYAYVAIAEPSTEATEILLQSLEATLSNGSYSQGQYYDVVPLPPGGSVVSFAMVDYTVMYVDNQGSWPLYGRHSVLVRQDGVVLVDDVRSSGGADQFNKELESWAEVLVKTQTDFGGGGGE